MRPSTSLPFWLTAAIASICVVAAPLAAVNVLPLSPSETLQMPGLAAGDEDRFEIEVATPGLLAIEVAAPGYDDVELGVDLLGAACAAAGSGRCTARIGQRSLRHLVLAIATPGTYRIRVGAVDRRQATAPYRLATRFLAAGHRRPAPDASHAGDDGVEEWESEILPLAPQPMPEIAGNHAESGDDGVEEWESEILPLRLAALPWCDGPEQADVALCASRLLAGTPVAAALDDGRLADYDHFAFTLRRPSIVRLETRGSADTFGTLYDRHGHRLAAADGGGTGQNFVLVAALGPGRYVVRVEAASPAIGPYRLSLESEPAR
ncbi:MAG: hypothetical protein D6696_15670 [Acidobacteria bacterium]|nr:MAG: hypothetical protein D6696_15670 [Acidobacteriota bacterium]